ncbi:MAG: dual specificity protein phosphatase [Chloroflexota bacterium]
MTGIPIARYSQVTEQIYVGAQHRKLGKQRLKRWGVTGVVNLRIEYDDAAHGLMLDGYCYLPTIDDDAPTLAHLYQGVEFMRQQIEAGGNVYIHCAGGIGRAPTMAVAYMVCTGFSVDDAVQIIKRTRPFINIMPVQMAQLRQLEKIEWEQRRADDTPDASTASES